MKPEDYGHDIVARNEEGYLYRDFSFPDRFVCLCGMRGEPFDLLPFNAIDAEKLRMWARTFEEAADRLETSSSSQARRKTAADSSR